MLRQVINMRRTLSQPGRHSSTLASFLASNMAKFSKNAGDILVLGIETTCDETAASLVLRRKNGTGTILSDVVLSQVEEHSEFGGVVPEIAARAHVEAIDTIVLQALDEAGVTFADLDGVAAAAGPGLIGGVIVGLMTAKAIALVHDLPLVGVNHLEAHALTARLTHGVAFPYLLLLVSGGHTQLIRVEGIGNYTRLGTTIDDALGEAFDKTAKLLGLGFPGGPAVEKAAKDGDPERFAFPRPMIKRDELHFSFSGLKTAVRQQAEKLAPLTDAVVSDICASFEAAVSDCVIDRVERALNREAALGHPARLVVAGGVAANQTIRLALKILADKLGVALTIPPTKLCTDNGAMIAWAGVERLALGMADSLDMAPRARWPLDPDAEPARGAGIKA